MPVIVLLSFVGFASAASGQARLIKGEDGAEMVLVPAGAFWVGSQTEDIQIRIDECTRSVRPENRDKCDDWYDAQYYRRGQDRNPPGPTSGQQRILRGGGWHSRPIASRTASRGNGVPDFRYNYVGFRCAKGLS